MHISISRLLQIHAIMKSQDFIFKDSRAVLPSKLTELLGSVCAEEQIVKRWWKSMAAYI